jgi:soluble lytic murein transglycosylase-like protein
VKSLPFALVLALAAAAPASAQIYSWKDAAGNLVLSDKPRADQGEMTTFPVPKSTFRATTPSDTDVVDAGTLTSPSRYDEMIEQYADRNGLSPDLVRAVIQVESGFNPYAVSPKGAMGLMQLMPATARELGVRNPFHPEENIRGGVVYLKQLMDQFDQDVTLALAAYNAGPKAVDRYDGVPPYRETKDYVKKVTNRAGPAADRPARTVIYKWMEIVQGRPVARYSDKPPVGIAYEIVGAR